MTLIFYPINVMFHNISLHGSVHILKQKEEMSCSPACLAMAVNYYGRNPDLEQIHKNCALGKEGVSLLGISKAAKIIGFKAIGGRLSLDVLADNAMLPCIVHWNQNHFVVVYKIKNIAREDIWFMFQTQPKD